MMLINSGFVHCVLYKAEVGQVVQELDTGSYFGEINCLPAILRGLIDARVSVAGIYLYLCLSIHPSIDRSIYLHIYLSIYRSIDLSIYLCPGARWTRCVSVSGMTRGGVAKIPLLL